MGITKSNIIKSRTGRYKDNEENRRLHRVGQQYGDKKAPVTEMDSKNLSKYDTKTLKNASKAMADKIREMRNTLDTLKKDDVQGNKSAIETIQAKIDSAMNGLVAVNFELAERGALKVTGAGDISIEDEKLKLKEEKQGRVYLGEAPNSSKVNLSKYLSAKAKENIDRILGQVIPTKSRAELATMYEDAVKNFNEGFDDMKKAARANMLYQILTIKAALDSKQGDKADIPLASDMSKEEFADYIASEKGAARKAEIEAKMEGFREEESNRMDELENRAVKSFSSMGVSHASIGHGKIELTFGEDGYGGRISLYGPSRWEPNQDYMVGVSSTGAVTPDADGAKVYIAAGKFLSESKLKKEVLSMMAEYGKIESDVSEKQRNFLKQYPDFSSDGTGVRVG